MSTPLLIAINPPKEISENILKIRKIAREKGENIYGYHDPHITLLVNSFTNFSNVEKEVISIAKRYKPFSAKIEGLYTFPLDPILQANTIVYKVEKTPTITALQKETIEKVSSLRTGEQVKWLLKQNPNYSKECIDNIQKYGYPFGPEDFIFHASICSVSNEHYKEIWEKIQKYNLSKTWLVNSISIFVYHENYGFKLFKRYKLGSLAKQNLKHSILL